MRPRLIRTAFLALVLVLAVSISTGYTYDSGRSCSRGYSSKSYSTKDKIMHKAHFMIENKEGLGLTDEQVKKIKDLKMKAKKESIKAEADIEITALDIKSAMWEEKIDTEAVNALIDKKYELKKQNAKSMVKTYAELKGILTAEQKAKMKELYKACKKKSK